MGLNCLASFAQRFQVRDAPVAHGQTVERLRSVRHPLRHRQHGDRVAVVVVRREGGQLRFDVAVRIAQIPGDPGTVDGRDT